MFFCFLIGKIDICKSIKISMVDNSSRITEVVGVGSEKIGGNYPILIQSMTDVSPSDLNATIEQCIRIFDSGARLVRVATPAIRDAKLLKEIRSGLNARGYTGPLAADVHYSANIAEMAASYVEKVRINPGNYIDKREYLSDSEEDWQDELGKIRNRLQSLVQICNRHQRAIRIGVNHGSLSERILRRYGDTPQGMVESAMEFLRILKGFDFHAIVVSLKSSNPLTMVQANRLLKERMLAEGMNYPFHLGVTEAGEGLEGRIRSAMGIGLLLCEGIGDTIRVSLTEAPEAEVPVARYILDYVHQIMHNDDVPSYFKPFQINDFGDYGQIRKAMQEFSGHFSPFVVSCKVFKQESAFNLQVEDRSEPFVCLPLNGLHQFEIRAVVESKSAFFVRFSISTEPEPLIDFLKDEKQAALLLPVNDLHLKIQKIYSLIRWIRQAGISCPIVLESEYQQKNIGEFALSLAIDLAPFLITEHPILQGFYIKNPHFPDSDIKSLILDILLVSRHRMSRTEFISCPGCGRTLFNLQEKTRQVKEAVGNIKGLKVAVMGCMVNGPGEMADAEVGFVGAGGGRVSLYAGKELVKKNIPEGEALEELLLLIKNKGFL